MSLGWSLRKYRERSGLSLGKLSGLCGVCQDYLHRIESGKVTNVGIEKLQAIAKALNITIHTLIDDSISKDHENITTIQHGGAG